MTKTRAENGPAAITHLNPADYRDGCEMCIATAATAEDYVTLPERIRPTRTGIVARYRHTCGHTWTCGWLTN